MTFNEDAVSELSSARSASRVPAAVGLTPKAWRTVPADGASVSSVDLESSGSGTTTLGLPGLTVTAIGTVETAYGILPLADAIGITFESASSAWIALQAHLLGSDVGPYHDLDGYV